jgi:hypothetical protein
MVVDPPADDIGGHMNLEVVRPSRHLQARSEIRAGSNGTASVITCLLNDDVRQEA